MESPGCTALAPFNPNQTMRYNGCGEIAVQETDPSPPCESTVTRGLLVHRQVEDDGSAIVGLPHPGHPEEVMLLRSTTNDGHVRGLPAPSRGR